MPTKIKDGSRLRLVGIRSLTVSISLGHFPLIIEQEILLNEINAVRQFKTLGVPHRIYEVSGLSFAALPAALIGTTPA
ncbi:hypothetical protein [Accumulibacter sp.]|uniref:hypothetical protein n=1 Tax=Accumulibacter sp. TaxID=2053492 RepID=UPI002602BDCF|nr:hypothetical protein [Accumulibacter sp.]